MLTLKTTVFFTYRGLVTLEFESSEIFASKEMTYAYYHIFQGIKRIKLRNSYRADMVETILPKRTKKKQGEHLKV